MRNNEVTGEVMDELEGKVVDEDEVVDEAEVVEEGEVAGEGECGIGGGNSFGTENDLYIRIEGERLHHTLIAVREEKHAV